MSCHPKVRKSWADLSEESGDDDLGPWSSITSNASTTIADCDNSLNEVEDQMVINVVHYAISTPKDLTWVTQELQRLALCREFSEHVKDALALHAWNEHRMQFVPGEVVDLAALLSALQNPGVDHFGEHFMKTFGKTTKYASLLLAMKSLSRSLLTCFSRQLVQVQLQIRLDGNYESRKISELIKPTENMLNRFIDCLKGSQFLSLDPKSVQVFRDTFSNWMLEWKTIFRTWKDILHEISASEKFAKTFQDLALESEESLVMCCDEKVQHLWTCIESIVEC